MIKSNTYKLVDLEGYEDRHPMSLSGGQQQKDRYRPGYR